VGGADCLEAAESALYAKEVIVVTALDDLEAVAGVGEWAEGVDERCEDTVIVGLRS